MVEAEHPTRDVQSVDDLAGWVLDDTVLPNARPRQGDLIRFTEAEDPLRKLGVVITADCDLDKKKHARLLTLVPLVSALVVAENYLIPEDCERKRGEIERFVFHNFGIDQSHEQDTKIALLREAVARTQKEGLGTAQVAAEFLIDDANYVSTQNYKLIMAAIGQKPKQYDSFRSQLRSRGDLLVLPDAVRLGVEGAIAWARHLWQIPLSDVALRTSEIASRPGERVARLDSPYRYRLTQLVGQVFSDIGLPDFTDSVDRHLEEAYR